MSNLIQLTGNAVITLGSKKDTYTITKNYTMTGSNGYGNAASITSSYQRLDFNGLGNVRYGVFQNNNDTSNTASITLASDVSGSNVMAVLQQGDTYLLPYSGSLILYAKTNNATTASILAYGAVVQ